MSATGEESPGTDEAPPARRPRALGAALVVVLLLLALGGPPALRAACLRADPQGVTEAVFDASVPPSTAAALLGKSWPGPARPAEALPDALDPWGRPFVCRDEVVGTVMTESGCLELHRWSVWSSGPDGVGSGEDDDVLAAGGPRSTMPAFAPGVWLYLHAGVVSLALGALLAAVALAVREARAPRRSTAREALGAILIALPFAIPCAGIGLAVGSVWPAEPQPRLVPPQVAAGVTAWVAFALALFAARLRRARS